MLRGKSADAALRGVDALQQLIEVQLAEDRHDDFAIRNEPRWIQVAKCLHELGEDLAERLLGLRLQFDRVAVAKGKAAEAIPLGLVLPARFGGNRLDHRASIGGNGEWRVLMASIDSGR